MPRTRVNIDPVEAAGLSDSLRALARRGELKRYRKGTVLIEENERGETLFIILSGRLKAYATDLRGREITYGVYGAGEYLGEMSLDGGPRSASVMTLEATQCAVVTGQTILRHIAEHPEFAFELLAKVIRRARAATLSAKQMALNDVYGRLAALLNTLSVPGADGTRAVTERLTHLDIANRVGCSREMVSRVMKDLEAGGYVDSASRPGCLLRSLPARW